MLEGVKITPLKTIPDGSWTISHMLSLDNPICEKFLEIYFSKAYLRVVKGCYLNRKMRVKYFDLKVIGLKYSILYGPKERYGRIISVFLRRSLENLLPLVSGRGEAESDFIFLSDKFVSGAV